jgi:hypothetical protein
LGDPLYSAAADCEGQDRAYLHAAALRLPLEDGSLLQVRRRAVPGARAARIGQG